MRKLEEKVLKKNWKNWTAHLARNPGLAGKLRLSVKNVNVCIHDFDDVKEESNKAASNDKHLLQE